MILNGVMAVFCVMAPNSVLLGTNYYIIMVEVSVRPWNDADFIWLLTIFVGYDQVNVIDLESCTGWDAARWCHCWHARL